MPDIAQSHVDRITYDCDISDLTGTRNISMSPTAYVAQSEGNYLIISKTRPPEMVPIWAPSDTTFQHQENGKLQPDM